MGIHLWSSRQFDAERLNPLWDEMLLNGGALLRGGRGLTSEVGGGRLQQTCLAQPSEGIDNTSEIF